MGPYAPARTLVRCAGDGAGHAHAAEGHGGHVGGPLRDEFAIRAVPAAGHAVGHDRRQQRLDGAKERDRNSIGQHRAHVG